MTDNSVETRRLKEYFDIELLREKQHSEYVIDRLKKKIRKLEAERDKARKERNQARIEAETLIAIIDDVQGNGAVYDTRELMDTLPWAKQPEDWRPLPRDM
ncbi:hypothetical protein [Pyramidobacter piscolens]|uniref:hypothetical protein n=1 Tax=Pyramidobacter piscolens TaxID=638849 RepID=UPI002493A704|nr:hypothetical protein [Pyramidobacter piscolens]